MGSVLRETNIAQKGMVELCSMFGRAIAFSLLVRLDGMCDAFIHLRCAVKLLPTPGVAMRNRLYDHCIGEQTLVDIAK